MVENEKIKIEIKKYDKTIFQLNELIRILLIDSDDVKEERVGDWIEYWERIERENKEIFDTIYTIDDKKLNLN